MSTFVAISSGLLASNQHIIGELPTGILHVRGTINQQAIDVLSYKIDIGAQI